MLKMLLNPNHPSNNYTAKLLRWQYKPLHNAQSKRWMHLVDVLAEREWPWFYILLFLPSAKHGIAVACHLSVCPSVRLSVTLVDCDHIDWNTSEIISPLVSLGCSLSADPNIMGLLQGEHPLNVGPKWPTPLLIWASETFDSKLRPNGYR